MYLRHATKRTKAGERTYWTLVRSVRRGTRVVQEVVANLGRLDPKEVREAAAIARHFLGPKANQLDFFEDTRELGPEHVHVGKVRVERGRAFGDVWLGWIMWQALGLDDFCNAHLPRGRETVPWAEIASILVIARLCEPSSELHIAEDWYRKTALSDMIGVAAEQVHHTRLYQGLDRLLEHILRTNVNDWTDEELWRTYVQLWQAEAAFRIHKTDLSIRPIWHQKVERVQSHILVCFLAFCMWKALEGWQGRAELGSSPRKLLDELKRIQTVDVVIPVVQGPELRLRCVMQPDEDLACLLERLGLRLPTRLRVPDAVSADVVGMRVPK